MAVEARLTEPVPSVEDRIALRLAELALDEQLVAWAVETRTPTAESAGPPPREADAPWEPVPTRAAEEFLREVPEALLTLMFPTVYEEDRSVKLKDLATVQALGAITHERMSAQMVKELGIDEDYDYHEEQQAIAGEQRAMPTGDLGVGDALARRVIGPAAANGADPARGGGDPAGGPAARLAVSPADGVNGNQPKRADVSLPELHDFRRQQRQAESEAARLRAEIETLRREVSALRERWAPNPSPATGADSGSAEQAVAVERTRAALEALALEVRHLRAEITPPAALPPIPSPPTPIEVHLPAQAAASSIIEVIQSPAVAMRHSVERDHRHPDDPEYDPRAPITRIIDEPISAPPAPA